MGETDEKVRDAGVEHALDLLRERFVVDALPLTDSPLAAAYHRVRVDLTDGDAHAVLLLASVTGSVLVEDTSLGVSLTVLTDDLARSLPSVPADSTRGLATNGELRRLLSALPRSPWLARAAAADLVRAPVREWGVAELLHRAPTRTWPARHVVALGSGGALASATAVAVALADGVPPEWAVRRVPTREPEW